MTDLEKSPVTRRTTATFKGRRIVVTLRKDDMIELRLERSRKPEVVFPIRYALDYPAHFPNTMHVDIKPRR